MMTMIFTVVTVLVVAIYDVYAIVTGGTENSISHMLINASYENPIIPFAVGVVAGHLFWRMKDTKATKAIADSFKNEKGHGYPSAKDWLKVLVIVVTFPVSVPALIIVGKIKDKKNEQ